MDQSGIWAEHGHAYAAAMPRRRTHNRRPTQASRDVRLGSRLQQMPHVGAAFESGRITSHYVSVLGACMHGRFQGRFAEFEEQMVEHAIALQWDDFVKLVDTWTDHADAGYEDERDQRESAAREMQLSRSLRNRGVIRGTLTPLAVERSGEGNVGRARHGLRPYHRGGPPRDRHPVTGQASNSEQVLTGRQIGNDLAAPGASLASTSGDRRRRLGVGAKNSNPWRTKWDGRPESR